MLVLTRKPNESIMIGDSIEIKVLAVEGDQVRLGIVAPKEVEVHRKEIFLAILEENRQASRAKVNQAFLRGLTRAGETGMKNEDEGTRQRDNTN
ncbi:hypothetical protein BSNK01_30300 [Bacillaceae bacterium]